MNLLADESIDKPIVDRLRHDGHDVAYVAELSPSISDDDVLQEANRQNLLLLTADKDFGELVFRQHRAHGGVVLVRIFGAPASLKADIVGETFRDRAAEMVGAFTVRWTPLVGRPMDVNKVVGLAARETPIGLARPLQLFNFSMC